MKGCIQYRVKSERAYSRYKYSFLSALFLHAHLSVERASSHCIYCICNEKKSIYKLQCHFPFMSMLEAELLSKPLQHKTERNTMLNARTTCPQEPKGIMNKETNSTNKTGTSPIVVIILLVIYDHQLAKALVP